MFSYVLLITLLFSIAGFFIGRLRAFHTVSGDASLLHSLPSYHGAYVGVWIAIPSIILVLLWSLFQAPLIDSLLIGSLPLEKTQGLNDSQLSLVLSEIKSAAAGNLFAKPDAHILAAAERYNSWMSYSQWLMSAIAIGLMVLFGLYTRSKIAKRFRARQHVERTFDGLMISCAAAAILVTVGIVVSLLIEALHFFESVSPLEFFFGLNWEPQIPIREGQVTAGGAFGAIPVFAGTLQIAFLAMLVATPLGLLSSIYLTEYSGSSFRKFIKPILEVLAGIPTVVYGFFAVLVVAPAMREFGISIGLDIAPNSALAAGSVMGVMLIPFVSSLSDDAITAVPDAMRDGSYGLGATKGETILKVLLPAALPGIMGGVLLALSRAIGETMIVVMAAGIIAKLTANPFEPVTTVTVQIVTLLIGDTEFDNPKTLAAFALGLVLFMVTLILNVIAQHIVRKYREQYD